MTKKSVEILGLPVISITEGFELGVSKTLVIDARKGAVAAITIEDEDWYRGVKLLPYSSVIAIGHDAVTVTSSENVLTLEEASDFEAMLDENVRIIGTKAITKTGTIDGKVTEFFIDDDGMVEKIQIVAPDGAESEIWANEISIFGKQVTVIGEPGDGANRQREAELCAAARAAKPEPVVVSVPEPEQKQETATEIEPEPTAAETAPAPEPAMEMTTEPQAMPMPEIEKPAEPEETPASRIAVPLEPEEMPAQEIPVQPEPEFPEVIEPEIVPELMGALAEAANPIPKPKTKRKPAAKPKEKEKPSSEPTNGSETETKAKPRTKRKTTAKPKKAAEPTEELVLELESEPVPKKKPSARAKKTAAAATEKAEETGKAAMARQRRFLLGKKAARDLLTADGVPVANAGEVITEEVLQKAQLSGKLIELSVIAQ